MSSLKHKDEFLLNEKEDDHNHNHVIELWSTTSNDSQTSDDNENHLKKKKNEHAKQAHYKNTLSLRQMDSLIAICDTFLPSITSVSSPHDESVERFFQTSASMAKTPELVGGYVSSRMKHPKLWLMRITLWMLSTWIGTFIICGRLSLSTQFPYLQKFSQISLDKRVHIFHSWSQSFFSLLRIFFKGIKILTCLVFFSQVDENAENISWKAAGYSGPDSNFKSQTQQTLTSTIMGQLGSENGLESENSQEKHELREEHISGPLYKGLINLKDHHTDMVASKLWQLGFPISINNHPTKNKTPDLSNPTMTIQCDAIVIGSGSGGGVVAGVLANAGYKVLVLEKGNYRARQNLSLLEGPTLDQMYLQGGLLSTDNMNAVILAGSTVGGGSTINWAASIQTPQHVINEWSDHYKLELFHSDMYREAQDAICKKMKVQSQYQDEGFNNAILRKGCQELGYHVDNIPRNAPPDHYCGWCCLGCKDGKKQGTAETWLLDLVNSGNGTILPECEATKIIHEKKMGRVRNTATGVAFSYEYNRRKQVCIVQSKVTIVACGALCTPELLRKSGLKNANIGKNLHLHPVTMGWGYFPEEDKKSYEGGIMTAMSTVVGNFDSNGYGAVIQTPSLHPGLFSSVMPWVSGPDIKTRMCRFSKTAHIFALGRDIGSGTVTSHSSIHYKLEKTDKDNLKKGLEKVLRILAAAGAEEIGTHHFKGKTLNVKKASVREFENFVMEESKQALKDFPEPICSAHQMGSCRMGVEPKSSAVKETGETWEVEGLYVADSSVFPTALGVNPMVTVQSIAYCTAQSVLEVLRRKRA